MSITPRKKQNKIARRKAVRNKVHKSAIAHATITGIIGSSDTLPLSPTTKQIPKCRKRKTLKSRNRKQRLARQQSTISQKNTLEFLANQSNNNGQITVTDDTPTTSTGQNCGELHKKPNNKKRRKLKSSRRRSLKRRPLRNQKSLKCKRNISVSRNTNISLEEGEIISEDENIKKNLARTEMNPNTNLMPAEDTDDDCICVEPETVEIVIEDDVPACSYANTNHNTALSCASLEQHVQNRSENQVKVGKLVTSTPFSGRAPASVFYEDVSRSRWFDSINSEDTFIDYPKLSTLGESTAHKRSARLKTAQLGNRPNDLSEVIVLDDTVSNLTLTITEQHFQNKIASAPNDDSVIFVSESSGKSNKPATPPLDFVPLVSDQVPNPIAIVKEQRTPRKTGKSTELFTASEKKQLVQYNNNAYNPSGGNCEIKQNQKSQKRLILIDGCNVAFNHSLNKEFSVKGLKICIDYFEKMGHDVKAVVPQFRMYKCSDAVVMNELHKSGKIVVTPCKNLPGKFTVSYDDRFVLQLASELDAAIISNDNYRDLINENTAFKKLIENRVIGFTWCNDLFMVAKDPYGKWGPSLQAILNRI